MKNHTPARALLRTYFLLGYAGQRGALHRPPWSALATYRAANAAGYAWEAGRLHAVLAGAQQPAAWETREPREQLHADRRALWRTARDMIGGSA